jgi:hypothetical protein
MEQDRITSLEQAITDIQTRQAGYDSRFDQVLAAIARLSQLTHTPSETTNIPKNRSEPGPFRARPANPPEFEGDRDKGSAFLNSCRTYIRLCPSEFPDEQTKIVWAMSYMKSGRAQKWTDRIFRWEQRPENAGHPKFIDWEDFCEVFKAEFTPAHSDALAINRLESAAYYQKSRSLDDYVDEFQDLIADAGYSDPKTVVVKFRRGLNPHIQNSVATMASGRPSDNNPDAWYAMARTVDQNRAANEAFASAYRAVPPAPRPSTTIPIRAVPPRPIHAHLSPTPGNPVPMDLDSTRKALGAPRCFRCKGTGHFGKDCPSQYDVRLMTTDELEEVIQQRMVRLDVAQPDPMNAPDDLPGDREGFHPDSE